MISCAKQYRCLGKQTGQGLGQELLVSLLVRSDGLQVGVERRRHAGVHEVLHGVVLHSFLVERGLEVLQGQSIVEDIS